MTGSRPVRVAVGEFEELVIRGLAQVLEEDDGLQVVGVGLDSAMLDWAVARSSPQVVVLDGGRVAREAVLTRLRRLRPEMVFLVLAHRPSRAYRMQMHSAGAACVSKDSSASSILATIRRAADGFLADERLLTPREIEVLDHLRQGRPAGEVAASLDIGVATVRTYIASILSKFDLDSKNELIGMPRPDFPEEAMAHLSDTQGPVAAVEKVPVQLSNVALGRVIRRLRKARSLTIGRLAREAGMSSAHLSTIEHGRCDTSLRTLVALTRVLEVSVSTLVSEAEAEVRSKRDPKMREKDGH
jgi:DNA-binding NarL/FixJ family response regulator/DNA-binding XRE family transcriptional regulator